MQGAFVILLLAVPFLYLYLSFLIGQAAERKGRSFYSWWMIAIFASPVLAGIVVASMAPPPTASSLVPCPRCKEPIRPYAEICRFCSTCLEWTGRQEA